MHDYRYYIKENEEHYEIWIGDQLYRHESAPFGEGVYDLLDFHETQINSIISFTNHYKYLAGEYFKRKQNGTIQENIAPAFNYNSNLFLFLYDVFEQYRDNDLDIPPEENSWFDFDFKQTDMTVSSDKFTSMISFARELVSAWSTDQEIDNRMLKELMQRFSITFELRDNELVEVLHPTCIEDIVSYTLCKSYFMITDKKMCVNTCRRCNRYFSTFKYGRSVQYCNHKNDTGYTCKEEAEMSVVGRKKTDEEKQIRKLYLKVYNAQRRRWQKGEMTKDQLEAWSAKGREQRDLCKKGKISFKTFEKWLDDNRDRFVFATIG